MNETPTPSPTRKRSQLYGPLILRSEDVQENIPKKVKIC